MRQFLTTTTQGDDVARDELHEVEEHALANKVTISEERPWQLRDKRLSTRAQSEHVGCENMCPSRIWADFGKLVRNPVRLRT